MSRMRDRLGLDLGTNSIGWAMLRLNIHNEFVVPLKSAFVFIYLGIFFIAGCTMPPKAIGINAGSTKPAQEVELLALFDKDRQALQFCLDPLSGWQGALPTRTNLIIGIDGKGKRYCMIAHDDDVAKYVNICNATLVMPKKCGVVMTSSAVYYDRLTEMLGQLKQWGGEANIVTPSTNRPTNQATDSVTNDKTEQGTLSKAKLKCNELGFKEKTEAYGKCVLELSR